MERIPYMTLVLKYDALCDTLNFFVSFYGHLCKIYASYDTLVYFLS
jgi:hypothetical protein